MSSLNNENAILVTIAEKSSDLPECERSLDELERLLHTAGGNAVARVIQIKDSFDPRTCIGSGKVKEISEVCKREEISLVIFDFELTPMQIRNLENDIGDSAADGIMELIAQDALKAAGRMEAGTTIALIIAIYMRNVIDIACPAASGNCVATFAAI